MRGPHGHISRACHAVEALVGVGNNHAGGAERCAGLLVIFATVLGNATILDVWLLKNATAALTPRNNRCCSVEMRERGGRFVSFGCREVQRVDVGGVCVRRVIPPDPEHFSILAKQPL